MTLTLAYRGQATVPLEVEGFTPEAAEQMSLAEIERFEVFHGNEKLPLAEFIDVSGDASDQHHVWQGDLAGVHWVGAKMSSGRLDIESNVGRHLGSEMRGGQIHVGGDAGDWVGAEMRGGLIQIRGHAGHLVALHIVEVLVE